MRHRVRFLSLLTALMISVVALTSAAQAAGSSTLSFSGWTFAAPLPQGRSLYDVASGAGRTVAVGDAGTILTASGSAWTDNSGWTDHGLSSITYGGGRFVAVGDGAAVTSVDGSTWVKANAAPDQYMNRVVYGEGRFVAVGFPAGIYTSTDGMTWTTIKTGAWLWDVAYGGGRFVATASSSVWVSDDGVTWSATPLKSTDLLGNVVYAGDHFVVLSNGGGVFTSPDGQTWTKVREPARQGMVFSFGLAYGNGLLVAVLSDETMVSADGGHSWDEDRTMVDLSNVRFVEGSFVAVGHKGRLLVSKDGKTWQSRITSPAPRLNGVAYGAGRFVAVGGKDILTSTNGQTWSSALHDTKLNLFGVWYGNGHFTAAGGSTGTDAPPVLLVSKDGQNWTNAGAPEVSPVYASDGGTEVVAADNGYWLTNGGGWWAGSKSVEGNITAITYGNGSFLLTTDQGLVYTANGRTPEQVGSISGKVAALAYGNNTFVAVGAGGFVATSPDGARWNAATSATKSDLLSITFADGRFMAVGLFGELLTSTDGKNWSELSLRTGDLTGAAFGSGRWVVVSNSGAILSAPASLAPACYTQFADVADTYPACQAISTLTTQGLVSGYPDGSFRPDRLISRAEFSKLLLTSLGLQPDTRSPVAFRDAADHWAAKGGYLQPLISRGFIQGFPDGTFRPDATITRAQAVALVVRAAGLTGARQAPYTDLSGSAWYASAVNAGFTARLMGRQANIVLWDGAIFAGDEPLTRAEAAMLLQNFRATR